MPCLIKGKDPCSEDKTIFDDKDYVIKCTRPT